MARAPLPIVRDGALLAGGERIALGGAAWQAWLAGPASGSFRFQGEGGSFTARREHQRNGWYWYAYRRSSGQLRKAYIGRAQDLTPARLEAVAAALAALAPAPAALNPPIAPGAPGLLATKLHPPPARPGLVPRPQLAQRFAAGLAGPLTTVIAPAGFGKTTLVAAWLASVAQTTQSAGQPNTEAAFRSHLSAFRFAWLSLDAGDNDPARFWAYVAAALDRALPGVAAAVQPLLHAAQEPPPALLRLLDALAAAPADVALALDDFHVIESASVQHALAFLVDHMPPRLHLVILSRAEPPLPLARLRARGQLHEIRAADLRFSADEAGQFLRRSMGLALPPEAVAALEQRTEGWAAGLQLAALAVRDRADHARFITTFAGSHRAVADYLAEEVIERQPAPVQRFLLHTSVLERMCAELCDAVLDDGQQTTDGRPPATDDRPPTGADASAIGRSPVVRGPWSVADGPSSTMLEHLERASLFVVPLDDERRWYRYHHLFGEMLRDRLRRRAPELPRVLHRRAAEWYRRAGLTTEAVGHALAAEDYALAADMIEAAVASVLWILNEVHTLTGWLTAFPPDVLRARPRLLLAQSWALLAQVRGAEVEQILRQVEANPELAREVHGQIAATRSFLLRLDGDIPAAVAAGLHALDALSDDEVNIRSLVANNLQNAYMALGDVPRAERALAALDEPRFLSHPFHRLNMVLGRAWTAQARGRLREAFAAAELALHTMRAAGQAEQASTGLIHVVLAELLYEWNDLPAAEEHAGRALALGDRWWNNDVLVNAYEVLGRARRARGDPAAERLFAEKDRLLLAYHSAGIARDVACGRARAALRDGRPDDARRWAASCGLTRPDDPEPMYAGEYSVLARVVLAQGRADEALALLGRLLQQAEAGEYAERVIELQRVRALALATLGRREEAYAAAAEALALAEPGGYVRSFVDEGPAMARLIEMALGRLRGQPALYAYARRVLAAFDLPAQRVPGPDQLTRREREVLALLAAGRLGPQIAAELHVEVSTVRSHVKSIYAKLGATGRVDALLRARAAGLLDP